MVDESVYDTDHKTLHSIEVDRDISSQSTTIAPKSPETANVRFQENRAEPNVTFQALALSLNQTRVPMRSIFPAIKDKVVPLITQTKFKWSQVSAVIAILFKLMLSFVYMIKL